jgi:Bacterial SH3 domain
MKTTYWWMLAIGMSLATPAARPDDQPPAPTPGTEPAKPAATTTPKAADKPAPAPAPVPAEPISGPGPAVVSQRTGTVNVRGKAAINSEVITRLNRGDRVTVLEEVTLAKPKQDEPAKWAKIALPTNAAVWAHASFLDQTNNSVKASRLNLRTGPGENYSVIGRLNRGATVKPIDQKGEWVKVEPPAEAYGFVAAHLLTRDTGAPILAAAATPGSAPPPIETAVPANPTPAPAEEPTVAATPVATPTPPPVDKPAVDAPAPAAPPEELIKRVVTREGIVERSVSIQAPTHFILQSLDTRKAINFLFSPATNVMLKDYRGQRIVVTGEEMLDERWPNTPVIEVEKIEAVP